MNKLELDPVSGYAHSPGASIERGFPPEKKELLIDEALKIIEDTGEMPNMTKLATSFGINLKTLYTHLKNDEKFKEKFHEVFLRGEAQLTSVMYSNAQRPSGYMDRITWLRRFGQGWNPDAQRGGLSVNVTFGAKAETTSASYLDAEVVPSE